jgi:hypothetical protein
LSGQYPRILPGQNTLHQEFEAAIYHRISVTEKMLASSNPAKKQPLKISIIEKRS